MTTPRTVAKRRTAEPAPLSHPAVLWVALVAAGAILAGVTYRFFDFDLFEHLVVGKYLWTARAIPHTQLWTWPTYGQPAMIPSWLFRALLWPFWEHGGVLGLFAWRWLTTLAAFALLFAAARRMGASPITSLVVLALCALPYRGRTLPRPETVAYVLFAAQILLLEPRRAGGPRRDIALILVAWIWINCHISFYIGLAHLGVHAIGAAWPTRAVPPAERRARTSRLLLVMLACLAVSFLNPFGWKAVAQPLDFLVRGRSELVYRTVGELGAIDWRIHWKSGLPLLAIGWPALIAWRVRRRGLDPVEALLCGWLTLQMLGSQRLRAFYALAAAPYVARDVSDLLAAWRGTRPPLPIPARAAAATVLIVACGWMEWSLPEFPLGVGLDMRQFPVAACDWIERHGVRGRVFNHFWLGGYVEYRFWPDRTRLPFMDGHLESGTAHDRTLYTEAQTRRDAWQRLDAEKRFDWLLLDLRLASAIPFRAFVEDDSSWACVFVDDAAAVFVRRNGPLATIAERFAYRRLRVSPPALQALIERGRTDATLRAEIESELARQIAESPEHEVALAIRDAIRSR